LEHLETLKRILIIINLQMLEHQPIFGLDLLAIFGKEMIIITIIHGTVVVVINQLGDRMMVVNTMGYAQTRIVLGLKCVFERNLPKQ